MHEKYETLPIARVWHLQLDINVVESSFGDLEVRGLRSFTEQQQKVTYTMARSFLSSKNIFFCTHHFDFNTKGDKNVLLRFHLQLNTDWERLFPQV